MPTVAELLDALNRIAPPHLAFPDDPIGLQVGRPEDEVGRCLVALDPTLAAVEAAVEHKAQALVTHHAAIYHPLRSLAGDSPQVRVLRSAIQNGIALLNAHTNWDAAQGGVNDTLAERLGLRNLKAFGGDVPARAFKLITFLPETALDPVLDALAEAGCGEIGLYRRCAFYSPGSGTYEPQPGAEPLIGEVGKRETADERRLEVLVPGHAKEAALEALRNAHPYDEPAYDLYELVNVAPIALPRMGELPEAVSAEEFARHVEERLGTKTRMYGNRRSSIGLAAVCGGAAGLYWRAAMEAGCDAFVTGEVRHHEGVEAAESGFCIIEAGHYHTEQPGMESLKDRLAGELPAVEFHLFEPGPGVGGRPL
ncbi:MAG: Nif3-like dinuclear metal center hexameric protein [Armatimonadetes bacterium]|nr:Nif3-like dinuclear metal center hexameric protein [Armatimonadota bacterium]